ncbi:MAG: hypothetical protein WBD16_04065 [Pyrinomonadaceae bacterium]
MEKNKEIIKNGQDIFAKYGEEISKACERAVRETLLKHKQAGNSVAVSHNGKVLLLQPAEIDVK